LNPLSIFVIERVKYISLWGLKRPFAIPLLIISVIQLFVIIYRYVFVPNPNGWMIISDFTIFFVMISLSVLMLMHIGILSPCGSRLAPSLLREKNKIIWTSKQGSPDRQVISLPAAGG
jgi:hypothetical protein